MTDAVAEVVPPDVGAGRLPHHPDCILCEVLAQITSRDGPGFEGLKGADAAALGFYIGWGLGGYGHGLSMCPSHHAELLQATEVCLDLLEQFTGQASDSVHPAARSVAMEDSESAHDNDVEADGRDG